MKKIETEKAPKAIGPYSQAILSDPFLFVSGQLPIDPKTGKLIPGGIQEQTKQVLLNLEAILKAAGLEFQDVVKTEIFLKNLDDFQAMNTLYAESFSHTIKPARYTVQVAKLPMDALIEIACIAKKKI